MNIWDWLILAAIALAVALAAVRIVRDRRRGKSCCGDCAACAGCVYPAKDPRHGPK